MKKLLVILFCLISIEVISQDNQFTGKYEKVYYENNVKKTKVITNPLINEGENRMVYENQSVFRKFINSSNVRWTFTEPAGIANDMAISGNGAVGYCGWALNNKRVSAYGNINSTSFWDYATSTSGDRSYVASSDTGIVVTGAYRNVYILSKNSNAPFFTFDLTTLSDTGTAGPVGITSNGNFIIATASRNDTSTVLGFNKSSNTPVWKLRIPTGIYGVRLSGNDSLAIVSTYSYYWVVNTFTGIVRYSGAITDGTQMTQGISGNGNIIATVNYKGFLKVYQWNGSAYNLLWQYQEPPGTYYNWADCVDISYDGTNIALGTLIFATSSSYDGRIRFFKVANGNTPVWSYVGMLDEVSWVSFSKNGKILAATSYGDISNTKEDLVVFKVSQYSSNPIFSVNMPGSPFICSISNDGTNLIAGGKAVHARTMGSGGTYYNIFVDTAEIVNVGNINQNVPKEYNLEQNYPNPFNPTTIINYSIPKSGLVTLKVYDVIGKEIASVVNEFKNAGNYEVQFNGENLTGGVYFYRITVNNFTDTKKLILIK